MSSMIGLLKCFCAMDETPHIPRMCTENYYTKLPRNNCNNIMDMSLLHTSSSSRSSSVPNNTPDMDETLMVDIVDRGGEQHFMVNEDNPEAMFDVLTMQSIRERYSDNDKVSSTEDVSVVISDQEFDNFVRDFPIDDSISECFAASPDQIVPSVNVAPKVSNSPVKQNKLKKKLVQNHQGEQTILSDEDARSSDSKKSKLIGNLFGRRHRGKDGYKPLKQADSATGNDINDAIIDACEHITKSYKKSKQSSSSNSVTSDKSGRKEKQSRSGGSGSGDGSSEKSQKVPSVTSSPNKVVWSAEPVDKLQLRKLPPVPGPGEVVVMNDTGTNGGDGKFTQEVVNRGVSKRGIYTGSTGSGIFERIETLPDEQLIQYLSTLSESSIRDVRDKYGNTVLQRCIVADKEETAIALVTNHPYLVDACNDEGLNVADLASKCGRSKVLVFLLETDSRYKTKEINIFTSVMNHAAANNKTECLNIILSHLKDGTSHQSLPLDANGNTAAHIAAVNGYLQSLQLLIESGFNVWGPNKDGNRPLQLAIQNNHMECFQYLLMVECSQCLLREAAVNAAKVERLMTQRSNLQASIHQIERHLNRYYAQFNDSLRNVVESRKTILQSVDAVYNGTTDILHRAGHDSNDDIRRGMENMKAEMQRLDDLLEFSPLANSSDILSRMVSAFEELVVSDKEQIGVNDGVQIKMDDARAMFSSMLRSCQQDLYSCDETAIQSNLNDVVKSLMKTLLSKDVLNIEHSRTLTDGNTRRHNQRYENTNNSDVPSTSANPVVKLRPRTENRHKARHQEHSRPKDSSVEQNGNFSLRRHFSNLSDADSESTLNELPLLESPSGTESVCASTVTSGVTCTDMTSEKTSRRGTMSGDTSDSESDWWDDPRHKRRHRSKLNRQNNVYEESETGSSVKLNLAHEDLPDDILRQHRLHQHLQSINKVNSHRNDFVETVITASGKRMGGKEHPSKISNKQVISSLSNGTKSSANSSIKNTKTNFKDKNKDKPRSKSTKLFSLQDVVSSREISPTEFLESYDRSRDTPELHWDEMSLTDIEETKHADKPWYEMSDDEESIIHTWRSDDEDDQSRDASRSLRMV